MPQIEIVVYIFLNPKIKTKHISNKPKITQLKPPFYLGSFWFVIPINLHSYPWVLVNTRSITSFYSQSQKWSTHLSLPAPNEDEFYFKDKSNFDCIFLKLFMYARAVMTSYVNIFLLLLVPLPNYKLN